MKGLFIVFLLTALRGFGQEHGLDYYVNHARDNSPLLKDYRGQQAALDLDSMLLRASYKVQVNGVSTNSYAPVVSGFGYDNAITNGGQLSAQVQAVRTFASKNNLAGQLQTIALDRRSVGNTAAVAEKDLQRAVTSQYISAYGSMLTMQFNEEIKALLEKEEHILKELTQGNIYKQADYLTFFVTLQQQRLIYRQSAIQYQNDYAMLNYLCGIVDTAGTALADPALRPAAWQGAYNSVFYQQFSIDSLKVLNQRSVLHYSYRPRFSAFADAGYLSSLAYRAEKNFGASFGVTLSVPIYDGRQRRMKYSKTEIAERTRSAYRDFFLRQYDQQVGQLMQQLHATQGLVAEIDDQIKYARTLIGVNERLLETGNAKITDYIIAINTYLNARNLATGNYISRLQVINQINYWQAL